MVSREVRDYVMSHIGCSANDVEGADVILVSEDGVLRREYVAQDGSRAMLKVASIDASQIRLLAVRLRDLPVQPIVVGIGMITNDRLHKACQSYDWPYMRISNGTEIRGIA